MIDWPLLLPKLILSLFGLLIGSFLNVVIYRLPRLMSITWVRSKCTNCGKMIYWYENIPVVSYIFLKGKCSRCSSRISFRYPLVEIITACAAWLLAPDYLSSHTVIEFLIYFSIFCLFLCQFMIDLEHKLLMDSLNLLLAGIFAYITLSQGQWQFALVGALVGFFVPYVVTWIFYKLRGVIGLGGGDIKLYGALGIILGAQSVMHNMFVSCTLGAIIGGVALAFKILKRDQPIPFGPFILVVAAVQIYFPQNFSEMMRALFNI